MSEEMRAPANGAEALLSFILWRMEQRHPGEIKELLKALETGLDPDAHHPNVTWAFRPKPDVEAVAPEIADALSLLRGIAALIETSDDK